MGVEPPEVLYSPDPLTEPVEASSEHMYELFQGTRDAAKYTLPSRTAVPVRIGHIGIKLPLLPINRLSVDGVYFHTSE